MPRPPMVTDCIFLFGPRAAGKSTVGKALVDLLPNWTFYDIDYEFRLRFESDRENAEDRPPVSYYEGCRKIMLDCMENERVIIALGGGAIVNDVTPEVGIRNFQDCRRRGALVLVLPARRRSRCCHIIYQRESKRRYVMTEDYVRQQFDQRVGRMRDYADGIVYGIAPRRLAQQVIRRYGLT